MSHSAPLAERVRPRTLDAFRGQSGLLAPGSPLRRAIESGALYSMILWGPPGSGKTTLARLIAHQGSAHLITLSAVLAGVKEIREAVAVAQRLRTEEGRASLLFIDEVHRFNKAQQDALLPHVEDGTFVFIGATTENPSFALNQALLSRARVHVLEPLGEADLTAILQAALADVEQGLGAHGLALDAEAAALIARAADGDARRALNLLEQAAAACEGRIDRAAVGSVLGDSVRRFDRGGDLFYDQISALHKAVRGSAPDAALYWLARMIDGGCDPLYLARRLVRIASEDIGNADPRALALAIDAWEAQARLGSPEGELALAQATLYLACAAKSNAVYTAWKAALADARASGSLPVPSHLRNAPTALMKELGYGRAYRYAHDEPHAYAAGETYFPEALGERRYYAPVDRGLEIRLREKLERLRALDQAARHGPQRSSKPASR